MLSSLLMLLSWPVLRTIPRPHTHEACALPLTDNFELLFLQFRIQYYVIECIIKICKDMCLDSPIIICLYFLNFVKSAV